MVISQRVINCTKRLLIADYNFIAVKVPQLILAHRMKKFVLLAGEARFKTPFAVNLISN